ncbi:hypothetical protein DSAG12_00927 [Promethearchaeum syntrophicum]|uniref:Tetratricopeptide repeat protein n=1 Tax=Promethearchaeum syntrophicum TaxID=2594042 RepID=A0A5B9D7L1_9ARCH|nr:hypothetical protein [Candidatus Prometheoarchaeum syntrophicum]QEE15104.1 hypothetical protein DSAG12_00927 [Candidatus Prometheoarchaeum syntrophicum]
MSNFDYDNDEYDVELIRANELVESATKLRKQNNIRGAISLYQKSIGIYLNSGAYMKIADVFNNIVSLVKKESEMLPIMEKLRRTINEIEKLDLLEELANLKLAHANLEYKSSNYLDAGNLFIEVADLYSKVDQDEFRKLIGMFYLRAAECFEKISRTKRAEKLILDAIRIFDSSIFDYRIYLKQLKEQIDNKQFSDAIETIREIAKFFRRLEIELESTPEEEGVFRNLKRNVLARLIHIVSEYNLLKMMCYHYIGEDEKVRNQADKSIKDLIKAIDFIKEELKQEYYSSADLHRLTFDVFLLQMFQEFADLQIEDPIFLIMSGLPKNVKEIIKKMRFYDYTVQILELNLKDNADLFETIALSQILDPYRDFIIKSLS